jgi:hypothetical protein
LALWHLHREAADKAFKLLFAKTGADAVETNDFLR